MSRAAVVFSHLRWDFVHQRPQHLLSRLARHYRVLFVEEPVYSGDVRPQMQYQRIAPGLTICRPHSPIDRAGFHDEQIPPMRAMLAELTRAESLTDYFAWFYTPMALPLLDGLAPALTVYDCMDELSAFLNAPKQIVQRERALLKRADLVFTGGTSLYRAKRPLHPNVHCFPSSVDAAHFASGGDAADHPAQAAVPRPRLGFFGVIDERIDTRLIAALADARPSWQIVLVGPVVKIDAEALPRRPNIHYLGKRSYEELPALVHGWDVCLLPFALNEATRYISPTKTLEYMAAGRPIVSTPIADVVAHYDGAVRIADGAPQFIAACEAALNESALERGRRETRMARHVAQTSWEYTAACMRELIERQLEGRGPRADGAGGSRDSGATARSVARGGAGPTAAVPSLTAATTASVTTRAAEYEAVVVGAGPTGLSAAYHLGKGSVLLEASSEVGGWCRSIREGGFTFDHAGHIMFSHDPYVHQLYQKLLGDNVHWQDREAWIWSKGCYTRYPFQGALHGLPPEVIKECVIGAIEARFGAIAAAPSATPSGAASAPAAVKDCCADGVAESTVKARAPASPAAGSAGAGVVGSETIDAPRNFQEFILKVWGAGIAKHFAFPYNRKIWAVPLEEMETSWLGGRVPLPDLGEIVDGALRPPPKPVGPNARFGYPLRGGFQALMEGFVPLLQGALHLNARVVRWWPSLHEVQLQDGRRYRYRQLVSTMPLPRLIALCAEPVPASVREASRRLRYTSVRCVNLGIGRPALTDKHWIYYPEDTLFHRIFVQGNASPHCNAPGGFGLTCEITYGPNKPLPCEGEALIDRCIEHAIQVGMIRADDPIWVRNQVDMPFAYVIYDHERARNVETIRNWLQPHDVTLAGRYSEWQYYNSDHAFIAGRRAAETVRSALELRAPATLDAS